MTFLERVDRNSHAAPEDIISLWSNKQRYLLALPYLNNFIMVRMIRVAINCRLLTISHGVMKGVSFMALRSLHLTANAHNGAVHRQRRW